jgi:U3 small nucleolar RNA-associated protein 15
MTTTTIETAPSSTNEFKKTASLQSKRPTAASVTWGQEGSSALNEARYWTQKLGLGPRKYDTSKAKYAHPRRLRLPSVRSAMAQQVLFGPLLASRHPPLAVVSGPRVNLYATAASGSSFIRALTAGQQKSNNAHLPFGDGDDGDDRHVGINDNVEPDRQVQTGGHLALCGAFRNDGRLMAVGTEVGEVRVCDVTMRSTLTTFSASKFSVRSVEWFRNGQHILAGGDDAVARVWNLSSTSKEKPLLSLVGHGDVIRCAALWQIDQTTARAGTTSDIITPTEWTQLAMTGSYDHTVRVWNVHSVDREMQDGRCLAVLLHGAPVEAICLMKSDQEDVPVWVLSAGGTTIKVWNPRTGRCVSTVSTHHRKTITSLLSVLRSNVDEGDSPRLKRLYSRRILSASLDGVVQFHSWNATTGFMKHLYSTKLHDSITSVATDRNGERLAFGTVSGDIIFRMKGPSVVSKKRTIEPRAGTYSFFQRGMNAVPGTGDCTVASQGKKRKLNKHDLAMKQFRYADALDEVLAGRQPSAIVGVLEELGKRRGLVPALSNRDEESLEPILSFVIRYIKRPHFTNILLGVAHKMIDIYGVVAGESDLVDELFKKLKHQVGLECRAQKGLMLLVGQIDAIMVNASQKEFDRNP